MLRLAEITRDNWQECIKLPISEDHQRFVQTNLYSLAEVRFHRGAEVRGVCNDGTMVGCTLFGPHEQHADMFWIYRLMISERERGKGYGKAALSLIADEARKLGYSKLGLSVDPDNTKALDLYGKVGFRSTGELDGRELIQVLLLRSEA